MNRNDVAWRGYWAACPTPFAKDGRLDLPTLRSLVDFYVGEGLHGILVNGTSGEWFSQSTDERRLVAQTAVEQAAGRLTVVVGCTDYTADLVVRHAQHAMNVGADGIATTPPPYSKPYADEVVEFYRDISRGTSAPVMAYNWPHGTSVDISTELALRIVDVHTVVALKDSTPDTAQFHATAAAVVAEVRVFGQFMSTDGFAELLAGHGDGTIGGGTLFGAPDAQFWESYWAGGHDACRAHAARIDALFPQLWLPGGWGGHHGAYQSQLKALMAMLGQPGGHPRRPRLPVTDPVALAEMRGVLEAAGLLPHVTAH